AHNRLNEVEFELKRAFTLAGLRLETLVAYNDENNHDWWTHQIISAARTYHYFADLGLDRRWVQLRLGVQNLIVPNWHVIVSFHHKESRAGLMAAVAFLTTTESGAEEGRQVTLGSTSEFA